MDPYLERSGLWEEVHAGLIVAVQQHLGARLRPRYRVAIERRTYLALLEPDASPGKPDVLIIATKPPLPQPVATASPQPATLTIELPMPEEVVERYLEVRDATTAAVVTVIEILSPTNKLPGEGRALYERKRLRVLGSATHLLEIDLLRAGPPLPMRLPAGTTSDYRIVVSRAPQRPQAQVLLFGVRDRIPDVPVPLHADEPEAMLPLNTILHELYDRAGYDLAISYDTPAEPPLTPADAAWAATLLG
jgi:hypothetical protein